ncbi:CapA family protein [Bacillus sp. 3255]|uniref:CapA family protein n=1 Tax=Bacillus sp. 3255 TaxID=2817904 RepID=UPI0028605840|nr:CapA family protein [Bacillus sp. 3255]MDR6879708.1 poly-gamma-glutamate synthesis protein (capsule biosynthesis protein) [Bacillus sp. 3255]
MLRNRKVVFVLLLVTLTGCFYTHTGGPAAPQEPRLHVQQAEPPARGMQPSPRAVPEKPEVNKATLAAIGDVLIHSEVYQDAKQKDGTYNFTGMFEAVRPYMQAPDILVANQETMIGGAALRLSGYPAFNSPHEVGDALKAAGVDVVTVANNHTLDRGEKVIQSALSYWDVLGIPYTGAYKSQEDRQKIRTLTVNKITFSFLSYSYGTNGIRQPKGKSYLINRIDMPQMAHDVAQAKLASDVVVVAMHWGNEYEPLPNDSQKALAYKLAELGVHIIIGNHPHVLQPPAWVTARNGHKTFVLYSLGNFISAQGGIPKRTGGIASILVKKISTKESSRIELSQPAFLPTFTYYRQMAEYKVFPLSKLSNGQLSGVKLHESQLRKHMRTYIQDLAFNDGSI